jgi:S1-C subfamily serine protease
MKKFVHLSLIFLFVGAASVSMAINGQAQATTAPTTVQSTAGAAQTATPDKTQFRRPVRKPFSPATVTVVADQSRVTPQVVTIVHRLSGVKMLRFLLRQAGEPGTVFTIDPESISSDAHASIVAGWALEDGKTIAVRLPQAGAELEFAEFPAFAPELKAQTEALASTPLSRTSPLTEPNLTVITRDGRKLTARYVGLDGQTGLSVLQVNSLVMPALAPPTTKELTPGQDVQIFAPARTNAEGEASTRNIYVKVSEVEARIATLIDTVGRLDRLTVRGAGLSPLVVGGIACDQSGKTLGIVEAIEGDNARIVSADSVRAAVQRVIERQASVPKPLLGVIGEPVEFAQRTAFLASGWPDDEASRFLGKPLGILLTTVRPGTPAALAKLRAGDVILRVNKQDIGSSEAFSKLLAEAGSGQLVQFLVQRPHTPDPFPIDVKLGGSFDSVFKYHFDFTPMAPKPNGLEGLGVETIVLSSGNLAQLGAENGVLIVAVEPESIAARSGLREGDVIQSIDGRVLRRGPVTPGLEFNPRRRHVISLVRKHEKKQLVLEPVE